MLTNKCKICNSNTYSIFSDKILKKYSVQYLQCDNCSFIQTEEVFWLNEAYADAITKQDIGLLYRNRIITPILKSLIKLFFDKKKDILDYGAGYGVLVRTMRDNGYNMFRHDKYCINIFAEGFDHYNDNKRYELLTAFEVFEHLNDPVSEVEKMLKLSDNIFFSTEVQPSKNITPDNWWYVMPETGQHIALYSITSLKYIAEKYNLHFYSNGKNLHLFTKKKINYFIFKLASKYRLSLIIDALLNDNPSLLSSDYNSIKANN
jgi:2-polyprenyl-3-methyl-5-hydroxy-6-metoxy-1,4-benzoquinol methylase